MPQIACKFYPNCKKGNLCRFSHPINNKTVQKPISSNTCSSANDGNILRDPPSSNISLCPSLKNASSSSISVDTLAESHIDCQCSICYEEAEYYGLLSECNHIFCLHCVKEWRGQKNISDIKRTCPACRKESLFYITILKETMIKLLRDINSSPSKGESTKRSLIDAQLKVRKSIKCRFINKRPPASNKCPFGNQCHYSHLDDEGNEIVVRKAPRRRRRRNLHEESNVEAYWIFYQQSMRFENMERDPWDLARIYGDDYEGDDFENPIYQSEVDVHDYVENMERDPWDLASIYGDLASIYGDDYEGDDFENPIYQSEVDVHDYGLYLTSDHIFSVHDYLNYCSGYFDDDSNESN